jgi:predicted  nucleic acid-binding Zn-ribbon protein
LHPDLVAISNVWQRDAVNDQLRAEHEGLSSAVAAATRELTAATAAATAAAAALEAAKKDERANSRSLDEYGQKRDSTRKMIDGGTTPDYAASTRQLEKILVIIDELETKGLELLDVLEGSERTLKTTLKAQGEAEKVLADAKAALAARDGAIRTELAALTKPRAAAWAELPADYHAPYQELRRRKRRALVNTVDGVCTQCSMRVPAQKVNEIQLGRAVHTCPGCQAYVLPVATDAGNG